MPSLFACKLLTCSTFQKELHILFADHEYDDSDDRDINRGFRQLPSRSAHRSANNASMRRRGSSSVRRGSMRATQDVEIVNIEDYVDEMGDDVADPKEINQPMSAKRRYK